uniref:Uncharacterized protein n=1 Tax=Anguilla anguilla TaxID=7936 RepID=A0A0E9SCV9_ANGAN
MVLLCITPGDKPKSQLNGFKLPTWNVNIGYI